MGTLPSRRVALAVAASFLFFLTLGSAASIAGVTVGWGQWGDLVGPASALSLGRNHLCAIGAATGAVFCTGDNEVGQSVPPPSVDGTSGSASVVAVGESHSCALQAGTGAVVCWGSNYYGQATPPPSIDGTLGSASVLAAGWLHSCAVQASTGAVVCWGVDDVRRPDAVLEIGGRPQST